MVQLSPAVVAIGGDAENLLYPGSNFETVVFLYNPSLVSANFTWGSVFSSQISESNRPTSAKSSCDEEFVVDQVFFNFLILFFYFLKYFLGGFCNYLLSSTKKKNGKSYLFIMQTINPLNILFFCFHLGGFN